MEKILNSCTNFLTMLAITMSIMALNFTHVQARDTRYDLFLQATGSWKMAVKEYTVSTSTDAWAPEQQDRPGRFFHGAQLESDLESRDPGPVTFHVNYPADGKFTFYIETVSGTGIIKIMLDNKELLNLTLTSGPMGKGPWIASRQTGQNTFQSDYYKEYSVSIPAGEHDISVQNMGTDWVSINYFIFTNYANKILDQQYQEWKEYASTLDDIQTRLATYKKIANEFSSLQPRDVNYDLVPTLQLQLENFEKLANFHTSLDYNLMRTEKELKEILDYLQSGKDYIKTKRGRIKMGYVSDIDDSYQPFDVVIPKHYDPSKQYALELALHGYQVELRKYSSLTGEDEDGMLDSLGIIRVALYGRRNHQYRGAAQRDLFDVIDIVKSRYSIDADRVYLTGSSMGGYGTWYNALTHPDQFAAISPVCPPAVIARNEPVWKTFSPIEYVANAQHLPSRIYHGDQDPSVNVSNSREMVKNLKKLDYDHIYFELPGVGHNAWDNAGADQERRPWLLQYTRNLYPNSVKFKLFYLKNGKAYWVHVTGKQKWDKFSVIEAEITGGNEITIHTNNISSFSLDLKHPALDNKKPVTVKIDKSTLTLSNTDGPGFYLLDNYWLQGTVPANGLIKKPGLEGPFIDMETGKFIIVYGTADTDRIELLKKIGTLLQDNYAVSDMDIKLVPDSEAIAQELDKTHNLYLIGSVDENLYLKKIVSGLPVSFNDTEFHMDGSHDRQYCGMQMIYPNPAQPDKYIFIDIYPQIVPEMDQALIYPVADYLIYHFKDNQLKVLKDDFFNSQWQIAE